MARSRISVRAFLIPVVLVIVGAVMIVTPIIGSLDLIKEPWADGLWSALIPASFVIGLIMGIVLVGWKRYHWLLLCYPAIATLYTLLYLLLSDRSPIAFTLPVAYVLGVTIVIGGGLAVLLLGCSLLVDQVHMAWLSKTD